MFLRPTSGTAHPHVCVWRCAGRQGAGDAAATRLRVVDALLSGAHEPGTSHYELLRAFTDDATLGRADGELQARGYRTHEFGDSLLIERVAGATAAQPGTSPYGTCQRKYAATTEPTAAPP